MEQWQEIAGAAAALGITGGGGYKLGAWFKEFRKERSEQRIAEFAAEAQAKRTDRETESAQNAVLIGKLNQMNDEAKEQLVDEQLKMDALRQELIESKDCCEKEKAVLRERYQEKRVSFARALERIRMLENAVKRLKDWNLEPFVADMADSSESSVSHPVLE